MNENRFAVIRYVMIVFFIIFVGIGFNKCNKRKIKDYNIVLIVVDTLRSDHLPFYGYSKNTAPFLFNLSKKAVIFNNAFSASSWTPPATASIFTSMYPFQHGVLRGLHAQKNNPNIVLNRIPEKITTITEVLKNNGYMTYAVTDNLNIGSRQGFARGFDKFANFMYKQAPNVNNVVKGWKKEIMKNGKYFLYLHYMDPHAPYHPREPWYIHFEEKRKHRISAYDSEINFVDEHIKELFNDFNWGKNTVFIITADHGEGLWDHGHMGHGKSLHREEIQVPLLIYMPNGQHHLRVNNNVSTIDILPTVRDILGIAKEKSDEGVSLLPLIEERHGDYKERTLFSYLWVKMKKKVEWRSVIYKNWHYIEKINEFKQLYLLLFDKKEKNNLANKNNNIVLLLKKRFEKFFHYCKKFKIINTKVKLSNKKIEKLKSLGYVN